MDKKQAELARGHWWGFAAMPEEMEYPLTADGEPMTAVCQFHAGEGMVYVFANLDYFFGDMDAESGHMGVWDASQYKVLYAPNRTNLHEHEVRYESGESAVPGPIYTNLPQWDNPQPPHCFTDEVAQEWPGYEVLVDVEENDDIDLRFYDCGELFFLIKPEDRIAKRFDRVVCVLYSY